MAQHDYNIGDQNGFDFLVDLNNALSAIATNNAGSSEPNPTFPHMIWFDTNNDLMKVRNEANSEWVIVAAKDGSGWTPYRQGTALGTASVQSDNRYAHRSNNLSDLGSATTARANLGAAALAIAGAGVGQFTGISATAGAALVLPAGGTWIYFYLLVNVGGVISGHLSGFAAGGSTIFGGASDIQPIGWAWRKA